MSDDEDLWDDIDVVVARDNEHSASTSEPLATAASHGGAGTNQALLLLQSSSGEEVIFKRQQQHQTSSSSSATFANSAALYAAMPTRTRSCAFVGAHLHGKSHLVQDLVGRRNSLTPTAAYDAQRELTTSLYVQSGAICGVNCKSHANRAPVLLTAADVPGHPNFAAEMPPAILLSDCAALVVDCIDGVTAATEQALDAVVSESVPLFLVVAKLDRILIELRIPPADAYKKLRHIVDSVNVLLQARGAPLVSPAHGTVVFLSSKFQVALTLPIAARKYAQEFGGSSSKIDATWLAAQLWGQTSFEATTRKFVPINSSNSSSISSSAKPSFVSFVLEPLFKAMIVALRGTDAALSATSSSSSSSSSASVSIVNLVKQKVAGVFGSYAENLPDSMLEAMDAAFYALTNFNNDIRSNNSSGSSSNALTAMTTKPYVVSLLQQMFGMPEPAVTLRMQHDKLRGAEGAKIRSELELLATATPTTTSPHQRPFGVLAAKTRLEVQIDGSNGGKRVARPFVVLKLLSGTLHLRQRVSVYSGPDAQMMHVAPKMMLIVMRGTELVPVQQVAAGATVLVDFVAVGEDDSFASPSSSSSASLMLSLAVPSLLIPGAGSNDSGEEQQHQQHRELLPVKRRHDIESLFCKVAIEPTDIKDLQKLQDVVATVCAARSGLRSSIDDTGDLVISGAGEVQLDAVLFDIRRHVPIRATAPFTAFAETVAADPCGVLRRHAQQQADQQAELVLAAFASPLGKETSAALSRGVFHDAKQSSSNDNLFSSSAAVMNRMRAECGWDLVDCDMFVDAIGVNSNCSAILFSACKHSSSALQQQQQQQQLSNIHRWATFGADTAVRRGPLCDEPVRNVGFTLVDIDIHQHNNNHNSSHSSNNIQDNSRRMTTMIGQGAATACARSVVRKAFLSAAPRLLEPVMEVHVTLPQARVAELTEMLRKRRGAVLYETPIPATTWTVLRGLLPLADSFGFETSVRVGTQGEAYPTLVFSEWALVPGDPLDATAACSPFEAATGVMLARDFVTKTRRRKGLPDKIELS